MRVRRPTVAVWALLVAGGWGLTLWLDEPAATSGPGPVRAPGSAANPEPGPQPESGACDAALRDGTRPPSASPSPSPAVVVTGRVYDCAVVR